jgi:hypothetical protein
MLNDWYKRCFRRVLVDMHIPDWNPAFLAKLDADEYADTILSGNITETMLYTNSHVGYALYPSKVGPVHAALQGKDFVGRVVERCHERDVAVVAYHSAVYNNAIFLQEPDWRIQPIDGEGVYEHNRYGVCCPNSPYRDFAVAQTEELCGLYPFDGIFFDMLFWPHVCYCDYCRKRFRAEAGAALPEVVDWNDPTWMAFQRARERWMAELAGLLTAAVRRTRPSMTVTHQMSPVLHGWGLAMPYYLTEHCDYCSGDFYGPAIQQSLVCKIFEAISTRKPFEFHTSRCVHLWDHVTMKTPVRMATQAALAPAHASAFMFIDAIDPEGTLNRGVYERIGAIFADMAPYEPYLGGDMCADVAIYVSPESRFDFAENGVPMSGQKQQASNMGLSGGMPHMNAVMGAAKALQEAHIPFAVVTPATLDRLGRYRVVIVPNVLIMSDAEIAALREYVANGGAIYASGYTSLVAEDGSPRADFGLADVFGVSYVDRGATGLSFLTVQDEGLAAVIAPQAQVIHTGGQFRVRATSAQVAATVTLPYYPADAGTVLRESFASIHSNPPGPTGTDPALCFASFGKGRACYAAGAIEAESALTNRVMIEHIVRRLLGGPAPVEADAPRFVELTVFDKPDARCMNISLVALREDDDCVPCEATVRVRLGEMKCVGLRALPGGEERPYTETEGVLSFEVKGIGTLAMFEVKYG